ncbi:MAG: lytic transglycosylase domain-containing protein [Clostridium sp.]
MFKKLAKMLLLIFVLAALIITFHKPILKQVYKIEYKNVIDTYAHKYNLDEYLVYALIKKESRYDPLAVSKKGAVGLMQIMPETGEYIASLIGEESFKESNLHDAQINIKYGTYYLAKLSKDFHTDVEAILAAYNGGEGNVRKWMSQNNDELDEDKIPFKQTRDYVKSIKRDYKIYHYLYPSE